MCSKMANLSVNHKSSNELQATNFISNCFEIQPGLIVSISSATDIESTNSGATMAGDREYIHFNHLLQGKFAARVKDVALTCYAGDINMGFSDGELFHTQHSEDFCNLEIMIKPCVLHDIAGEKLSGINFDHEIGFFIKKGISCPKAKTAASRIVSLIKQSIHRPLLLHSATLEYLYWHLCALEVERSREHLSAREKRQLSVAKDYLINDLSSPPTIGELAKTVGLNQCKLKRGFKIVFGKSIYAYFQEERMHRAMDLLKNNNVTETAMILGYSNFSHFSTAFRKQFGLLPKEARRELVPDFKFCLKPG